MPDYSDALGLDGRRMERQMRFLEDRADWHQRRETPLDLATAAALRRDAGLVALLLGDVGRTRAALARAGAAMAAIGLYAGYLLQRLAGPDRADDLSASPAIERFMAGMPPDGDGEAPGGRAAPFERGSAQSPRQLLSLYQAMGGVGIRDVRARRAADAASERLQVNGSAPVGVSGMPVATYVPLFDRVGADAATGTDRDRIYAASIRRRELIEAAQADRHHWRMLLQPAELVDLDMIALGANAIGAGGRSPATLLETERFGTAAAVPFLLARDLAAPSAE